MIDSSNVLGIDEAGRGPVMGPLVIGIIHWDQPEIPEEVPLTDSKQLSPSDRKTTYDVITNKCDYKILSIPAWVISTSPESLPTIEKDAICQALKEMGQDDVICDRLTAGETLHNQIRNRFPERNFQFETGADERYKSVAAASILAKVTRDRAMDAIARKWGTVGSGYPSDPKTKSWLKERGHSKKSWPPMVRTSWSTVKNIEANVEQTQMFSHQSN